MTADTVTISWGEFTSRTLPAIGCGVWLDRMSDLERIARQLDDVAPRHLDVLLDLRDTRAVPRLVELITLADDRNVAVWLYAICEDEKPARSLSSLARAFARMANPPAGVLLTPAAYLKSYQPNGVWPSSASPSVALAAARERWPDMALGGGVPTYFTELNRCRPDPAAIDFITHAVSPIVHAADDRSVMETLESIPAIVASSRALAPGVPYRITTTAIGAWTNPYGECLTPNDGTQRVTLSENDPRQRGQFAAAWAVGFVIRAAIAGADSLTLSSLGPPFDVGDAPGYPVRHVIAGLARSTGRPLRQLKLDGAELAALAWQTESPAVSEVWIANLTAEGVVLRLKDVSIVELALLDAHDDGFRPRPDALVRLRAGDTESLAGFAILKLHVQNLA
ncbi:hypothetical protein [Salinicola halimionae]|uniref:hypothetical protein n=1 Tax=Salinicola halimionae TaxID=1949081 RepID=UPI000DA19D7C|nr:hypothetical protein [Salinicola halimionae]